jgi:N-acetylmuramoyl-L-alanine amidase
MTQILRTRGTAAAAGVFRLAAVVPLLVLLTSPAAAQTAAASYNNALAREETLRTTAAPQLAAYRASMTAYEAIVLKYYLSGYADNALWQGAGVALTAYERFGDEADKKNGLRYLAWLKKEYPTSPFIKHIDDRVKAFAAAHPVVAPATVAPVAPAPVTTRPAVDSPPTAPSGASPSTAPSTAPPPPEPVAPPSPVAPPTPPKSGGGPAQIRDIRRSLLPKGERLTIEIDAGVTYASDRIANPDRVFVDLRNATMLDPVMDRAQAITGTLISTVRCGARPDQSTRVVIELKGHPRHSMYVLYDPYRLVIDLESDALAAVQPDAVAKPPAIDSSVTPFAAATAAPTSPSNTAAISPSNLAAMPPSNAAPASPSNAAPAPPATTSTGAYTIGRQLGLGISRIVIDPGHGGHDPGAQSNGINESELVLDIALRLEKLLADHPGTEVFLTRRTDEFVPLQERTAIANREGADLFLSIHANANTLPTARGVETYFLNFANTADAKAVATRENETSAATMGNLPELVKSITLNNKLAESKELATLVQDSMVKRLKAQNASVRDLGVKQAPFVVLIGAEMPSVLAEISFVTNKSEALLLKQPAYRQRIAQSLCDAVVRYQSSLKRVTTVAGKDRDW